MWLQSAFSGFFLGLGLIMAIGAQNVFVLQQGLRRAHVFTVCLTCAASDAIFISFGVWAFALFENTTDWSGSALFVAGAAFLIVYGALNARRALWPKEDGQDAITVTPDSWRAVFLMCLAITWLNPHVYLDTVVLLGTVSTQHEARAAFALGAILASFVFFFSLGYGARRLSHLFQSRRAWRVLDGMVAIIMWSLAWRLLSGH